MPMNYFDLFELPVSLKTDKALIQKKYYALSRQWHPDNCVLSDKATMAKAEEMTALIHAAKTVLEQPYERLAYILKQGQFIQDDEKYALSSQFLGAMMDINEQSMDGDYKENETLRSTLLTELQDQELTLYETVKNYFDAEVLILTDESALLLKDYYYKKKYLQRLRDQLN